MNLLNRFLERTTFDSYEDFKTNYKLIVPEVFNFGYDIVDEYARLQPDKPALVWVNNDGEKLLEKRYTFGDISRLSNKTANALREKGICYGDKVMLILRQRPEVWITLVALCKLGAIAIPASFQLTAHDIVYRCNAAPVKFICAVDDTDVVKAVCDARPECPTLTGVAILGGGPEAVVDHSLPGNIPEDCFDYRAMIDGASEEFERVHTDNGDTMLTYFSSGTSGMPKMIVHDFRYPLGHITTAKYWQHVEDEGLHLTVSDSGWAKFAWGKIYGQWICGAVMVAFDEQTRFTPAKLMAAMAHLKITTFCAPPTIYRFMIKEGIMPEAFAGVHHCCTAGEPLFAEVTNTFKAEVGLDIHEGFGQTEGPVLLGNFGWDPIKPGSTGKPTALMDIDLIDNDGNPVEDGNVGRLVIRNAGTHPVGLFLEYYKDDAAMERSWIDGMYDTGDMAWRDADGYFHFEGRSDDVIKCSGYRIGPYEVESVLITHPAVLECAVTAAPDPIRGQVVKATIVLTKGYTASDELVKELQNHVKHNTAPYKYPRIVEFAASLPKTTSGKIRRVEIRDRDAGESK
ncbi:MAG: AMP-binding protein [Clostridiales bacterium]|nr:AMP-binding protein [Clostridiales bacterium]